MDKLPELSLNLNPTVNEEFIEKKVKKLDLKVYTFSIPFFGFEFGNWMVNKGKAVKINKQSGGYLYIDINSIKKRIDNKELSEDELYNWFDRSKDIDGKVIQILFNKLGREGDINRFEKLWIGSDGKTLKGNFKTENLNGEGKFIDEDKTTYEGNFVNGKLNGIGKRTSKEGNIKQGMFRNGLLNGGGTCTWKDGSEWVGTFVDGKLNGQKCKKKERDVTYEGTFVDGKLNGQGKILWNNGDEDTGTFKDGDLNGEGVSKHNGTTYVGTFANGKYHGKGKLTWDDGSVEEGTFKNGSLDNGTRFLPDIPEVQKGSFMNGYLTNGTIIIRGETRLEGNFIREGKRNIFFNGKAENWRFPEGVYSGNFENGKRQGIGKWVANDGAILDGTFSRGVLINGTFRNKEGITFKGDFVNGKLNGKGIITDKDGSIYEGMFVRGKLDGEGKILWKNGGVDKGTFKNGSLIEGEVKEGNSTLNGTFHKVGDRIELLKGTAKDIDWDDGVYSGEVIEGKRHGEGKLVRKDGSIFEGSFDNDLIIKGKLTDREGNVYEGKFINGKLDGEVKITRKNGDLDVGTFENGSFISFRDKTGTIYEGIFVNGKLNGKGKITFKNGLVKEGNFKNGLLNEKGKKIWLGKNGTELKVQEGIFKDDYLVVGVVREPDGVLKGKFRKVVNHVDLFEGSAKNRKWNGGIYNGNVENGKRHGLGEWVGEDGKRFKGTFENDVLINGTILDKDGTTYDGKFVNGKLEGKGKIIFKNGVVEDGIFENGVLKNGTFTDEEGTTYTGSFDENRKLKGEGIIKWKEGFVAEGEFKDGLLNGVGKKTWPETNTTKLKVHEGTFKNDWLVNGEIKIGDETFNGILDDNNGNIHLKNGIAENITWDDGVYSGHIENGNLHGEGRWVGNDGTVKDGNFDRGVFVQGKFTDKDKTIYIGTFSKGKCIGTKKTINGKEETGIFEIK